MKLKTLALMGAVCALVTLNSCKKDDDDNKQTSSSSSIEGNWKMTAQTATISMGSVDTTMNTYNDFDACEKDDIIRFNADKTVTHLAGAIKCNPSEPDSESRGTWSLSSDNKKLTVSDGGSDVYDVAILNATTLQLKMKDSDNGIPYTTTTTFTRQ